MNNKGFTLIELLVVVLIIGILTGIALPQYTKAVNRARGTEALLALRTVANAANAYYMEHRTYPASTDDLVVSLPEMQNFTLSTKVISNSRYGITASLSDMGDDAASLNLTASKGTTGDFYCIGADCSSYFPNASRMLFLASGIKASALDLSSFSKYFVTTELRQASVGELATATKTLE